MTRPYITAALCATIAPQCVVLLGIVVNAATPLWTGLRTRQFCRDRESGGREPPLPAWEGGPPGRHAGWKPALLDHPPGLPPDCRAVAFFAPKDTAVQLEDALRSGGLAVVMVSETGRAALKDVIPHPAQD